MITRDMSSALASSAAIWPETTTASKPLQPVESAAALVAVCTAKSYRLDVRSDEGDDLVGVDDEDSLGGGFRRQQRLRSEDSQRFRDSGAGEPLPSGLAWNAKPSRAYFK